MGLIAEAWFGRSLLKAFDAQCYEHDGGVFLKRGSLMGDHRLFDICHAPRPLTCFGRSTHACDPPPPATERPGIPKDEPRPARCLREMDRVLHAIATVDRMTGRLLRVSANGCGLELATVEVRHEGGGRARMRLEFAWHHRVYVSVAGWEKAPPFEVAKALTEAIAKAFGGADQ